MRARILHILILILILIIIITTLLLLLIIMPRSSISIKIITSMATLLPTILTLNSNSYTGDRRQQPLSRSYDFGADDYKHWPPFRGHMELEWFYASLRKWVGETD